MARDEFAKPASLGRALVRLRKRLNVPPEAKAGDVRAAVMAFLGLSSILARRIWRAAGLVSMGWSIRLQSTTGQREAKFG